MRLRYREIGTTEVDMDFLYNLLINRDPSINISHKKMPSFEKHCEFWKSKPYPQAEMILNPDVKVPIGYWYVTDRLEVGIFLHSLYQGRGLGHQVLKHIKRLNHRRRLVANINPSNCRSINLFQLNGFHHIQNTYALEGK